MSEKYPIPALPVLEGLALAEACHEFREEIKRSLFITRLGLARQVAEARSFIEAVRAAHPDATHNCWAFVAGPPGESSPMGYSDDGEPQGTAGKPMLAQLRHSGLGEIVAVSTRYFGGVKLGPGGLVRAYQGGVQGALETVPIIWRMPLATLELRMDYRHIARVKQLLSRFEGRTLAENFAEQALWHIELPEDKAAPFMTALADATNGTASVRPLV